MNQTIKKVMTVAFLSLIICSACTTAKKIDLSTEAGIDLIKALGEEEGDVLSALIDAPIEDISQDNNLSKENLHLYKMVEKINGITMESELRFTKVNDIYCLSGYTKKALFPDWPNEKDRETLTKVAQNLYLAYGEDSEGKKEFIIPETKGPTMQASWKPKQDETKYINLAANDEGYLFILVVENAL